MKRNFALFIFFSINLTLLFAQSDNLILRRVYLEPVKTSTESHDKITESTPGMLFGYITGIQPIIRVYDPEEAHSIINTNLVEKGPDESAVIIELYEKGTLIDSAEFVYQKGDLNYSDFKDFIEQTAFQFKPYLNRVEPEVITKTLAKDEELRKTIKRIEFREKMARSNEITLYMGSIFKSIHREADEEGGGLKSDIAPFPLILEYRRFFSKRSGLAILLFLEYNNYQEYGFESEESKNTLILPGIGYTFRTLGRVSMDLKISYLFGVSIVKAVETIPGLDMLPDERRVFFFHYFGFHIGFSFNLTPMVSLKTATGLYLNPKAIVNGFEEGSGNYNASGTALHLQLLTLGLSFRF
jgi:hypothetical protein